MKLYEVTTPEGYPQLRHRKDEAKKEDPNYRTVEVETDLHSLMARLNDLMRRAHAAENGVVHVDLESYSVDEVVHVDVAPPQVKIVVSMPPHAARNEAQIAWEEFIHDIPIGEQYRLAALRMIIDAREKEVNND